MTIFLTLPYENIYWKRPEQGHITTELRYPGQLHGCHFLVGKNYKARDNYGSKVTLQKR